MVTVQVSKTNDPNEVWLQKVQQLASATKSEAYGVKCFQGRWKMISNRLDKLPAHFTQLKDSPDFSKNVLCAELLESIVASLEETRELAKECTELTYRGKLQTQSKLDALVTRFDLHLRDCQLVIKSGVLQDSTPSGVSSGSTKEAVKWTVKDLLARLQIGSTNSKLKALIALVNLMQEDDKKALVVAGQGGISVLVQLLNKSAVALREKAAAAICKLAAIDSLEYRAVMEGALPSLVRILETGSSDASENAVLALQCMTRSSENACSVASHGGVHALLETCRSGTPGAQAAAAGALWNLSNFAELRHGMVEEGSIPILLHLVCSGTVSAQENAVGTLQNLSQNDERARQLIVREDGAQPLLRFLDIAPSQAAKELGIGILRNLSISEANVPALILAGILPRLAFLLASEPSKVQQTAAAALCHLSTSTEAKKAIGEAGCISPLVTMLDGKTSIVQEYAAQALSSLLVVESNRRLFLVEENAISGLVRLLESTDQIVTRQFVMSALFALAESGRCRKQMISAGACYLLGRLADAEVPGAKKLLNRLESGKLRNMLKKLDL
ncbi:hypothetical protein O6H91_03G057400 [Diphasiastrum complanatum]|uniref:Uncharacterized protein n=4 Tax=Diphasiastrum complanatum TaxID=34168 RepID=A0ACC2E6P2_DIPCM|nr:hypothetical protein O6H91_03G057400 [Diphasiastrum complanatum]KAJ7562170.1 hypothetical protein O6H91_03G057400 [Diphasiastrum complanatum]KAJ7562171.1 hypothetical protein O6H91_03G057400 [Diphasiastrum complanatum]KAJ7562172.1 hypothetical protein O6H91_03G057400 [Diphasiastrum complanatum]